jgi:hypothetical protein
LLGSRYMPSWSEGGKEGTCLPLGVRGNKDKVDGTNKDDGTNKGATAWTVDKATAQLTWNLQ